MSKLNKYRQGNAHECQPEVSDWILCADFEDDMPRDGVERTDWHNQVLADIESETGIVMSDLVVTENQGDPDYTEVGRRLMENGYDIYESDNYFEVYDHATTCDSCDDESCAELTTTYINHNHA